MDEDDQLHCIFKLLGTPTEETWEGVTQLPKYKPYPMYMAQANWQKVVPNLCNDGRQVLSALLQCNPSRRMSAAEGLQHAYFSCFIQNN